MKNEVEDDEVVDDYLNPAEVDGAIPPCNAWARCCPAPRDGRHRRIWGVAHAALVGRRPRYTQNLISERISATDGPARPLFAEPKTADDKKRDADRNR